MSGNTGVLGAVTIRMPTDALPRGHTERPAQDSRRHGKERLREIEEKAFRETKSVPGVSVFAVIGTIVVAILMLFVVLAQINYNEVAGESVRLSAQISELTDKYKTLEFAFESSIDIREVERIAKDELGMTVPDAAQVITITASPRDIAIPVTAEEENSVQGFAAFIGSLTDYFKRDR